MILPSQRDEFDIPRGVCYLNAAYMTPLTNAQKKRGEEALALSCHPWQIGAEDFFTTAAEVCALGALIMNVAANDVAIVPSVSYGISTAARNLPLSAGGAVLLLEEQFPSNYYPWRTAANAAGADIVTVSKPEDANWTQAILESLDLYGARVEIVSIANVYWSSGAMIDLIAVSRACKAVGAALVLDLSQSLGAMPTDIGAIDPDFMVAAGYKWLFAPYSISLMYVAPRWQSGVPLEEGWITRENSRDFANLVQYRDGFEPGARRFDMGERANHVLAPIFHEGLKQLVRWGIANIADTLGAINARLAVELAENGFGPLSADVRCPHILGVDVGDRGTALLAALQRAGVSVSLRGELLRIAPHLWVDEEDEAMFAQALRCA